MDVSSNSSGKGNSLPASIYRYTAAAVLIWTIIIAVSLLWSISRERLNTRELAKMEAQLHFNKDQAFRMWASLHGGVYVTPTEDTPPNPYLKHVQDRDILTDSGKVLTLVNPAYMLRQVMDFYSELYGVEGHLTSLKVLNPDNAPDEWEQNALGTFETGASEVIEFTNKDGEEFLRFMRPLKTEKKCLKCHEFQGYKEGDVRGGIAVSVPLKQYIAIEYKAVNSMILTHGLFWGVGFIVIGFVSYRGKQRLEERLEAKALLEKQAYYDHLTGLPNRTLFTRHLKEETELATNQSGYMFAVLMIDLDRFKVIVDSLGHAVGDEFLIAVSKRLRACLRPDNTVARFGGDEYAILLKNNKNLKSVTSVADRIQHKLSAPFNIDGHEVFTTASIGISLSARRYENAEDMIRDADSAMYRAKAHGRSCYELFDSQMYTSAMLLLNMEVDLRKTVEQEEFQVHYQPVVSVLSGEITGVEALVRWNHPEKGYIPPMEFIPLAEETGLISNISEYVLQTACIQHIEWKSAGYPGLLMKVNFSACQFYQNKILDLIKKILRETGMNAKSLDIEVTENIATEERSIAILKEISDMGIHISIDDFGTGYSSLGALNRLPINTLKIDKSFIRDIVFDPNARAIVRAIIVMGHTMKMKVLAEGVETKEQLEFLQINKCDEVQGFLFSQPVNNKDLINLLKRKASVI